MKDVTIRRIKIFQNIHLPVYRKTRSGTSIPKYRFKFSKLCQTPQHVRVCFLYLRVRKT